MSTAHQMKLFVIPDFQKTEGRKMGAGGGGLEGERAIHITKYLDQFLMGLPETFTIGLIFVRESKQGVATLCFNQQCTKT